MKTGYLFILTLIVFAGMSFTHFISQEVVVENCGEISMGKYKLDLARGEMQTDISRDALVANFKAGLSFKGSSKCPGTYEIVDFDLKIDAMRDVQYNYEFGFVRDMQSMEDYLLVRYFNDALRLNFSNLRVENAAGRVLEIPTVTFVVR